jgi:FHS family L-fucose permease-like MFS transporter
MKTSALDSSTMRFGQPMRFSLLPSERLLYLVYFIYFFCGMTQSFESVILPELKEYFHLGYQQQMYVVFAKNIPFLFCPLLALVIQRAGYVRSLGAAMVMYATGTLLLVPALHTSHYAIVLLGFSIIGTGFTLHMVAGNPMISALGPPDSSSSRLNLGNALGAVAQIMAPASLALIIPAIAVTIQSKIPYITGLLIVLGTLLGLIAAATFSLRSSFTDYTDVSSGAPSSRAGERSAWRNPAVLAGACAIFLVLGAEASLFSLFRNFLEDPKIASLSSHASQRLFTLYFIFFAAGRLSAAWLQRRISPALHLVINLVAALISLGVLLFATGTTAVIALLALGFFVSVFFPTYYALILSHAGHWKAQASGILTIGFLGAAVVPVLQGRIADHAGLQFSYALEAGIYLLLLVYTGLSLWRRRPATSPAGRVLASG